MPSRCAPSTQAPPPADALDDATRAAVRAAVSGWFARAQRRLPWRDGYEPYQVWVAEIMLQQTQVETVRPYFERWLARFPHVQAVADAPLADVLKAWEGLGYYARARNLHRAAQTLVREHGGRLPADLASLQALPGVGRYTAGAIRSIGFDHPAPIVDGNVGRVLGRLVALDVPARSTAGQHRLWGLAEALVPPEGARDFNQGLMELGALVCRPAAPDCPACPLRPHCAARAAGNPEAVPPAPPRRERPLRTGALLLLQDAAGRVLLRRRPPEGVWGGLWEPPWSERERGESPAAVARRLLATLPVGPGAGRAASRPTLRRAGEVAHGLTHFALRLDCYRARVASAPDSYAQGADNAADTADGSGPDAVLCWADAGRVAALPLTRLAHKALQFVRD